VLQFDNLKYGIGQARHRWLSKDDVLNTRSLSELKQLFAQRPAVIFRRSPDGCAPNVAATDRSRADAVRGGDGRRGNAAMLTRTGRDGRE
jgi:hypothetical protein